MKGASPASRLAASIITFGLAIGCNTGSRSGVPVDFGPQTDAKSITTAVAKTVRDTDPTLVKVGAFGRFLTNDIIGGGTLVLTVANTSQEVTARNIANNVLTLQVMEKITEYHGNSNTPQKVTRSFQLNWQLPSQTTPEVLGNDPITAPTALEKALHQYSSTKTTASASPGATYHRLIQWEDTGPAPANVASQPNCLGLPKCQMRLRHVNFDIVVWDTPQGNRIHVELTVSPDVPQTIGFNMNPIWEYIPGLVRSCITRLVSIGTDGRNSTLISECKDVINFAFDSSQLNEPQIDPSAP
jgi:hypothetical protein